MIFSADDREAVLSRVLELGEADHRLEAAVLTGSIGSDSADRWSDIDVAFVVSDTESCEMIAEDWKEGCYRSLPVAHHYETAFGTTLVRGFLLDNGLEVDISFTPSAEFTVWSPVSVVFDRRGRTTQIAAVPEEWVPTPDWQGQAGFAWHDVLHACVAANRNKPWQSLFYLQRIRNRTLALASERRGIDADEFKHVDELPAAELEPLTASLVNDLSAASLIEAIDVATRAFLDELRRGDPRLASGLAQPLAAFLDASREWVAETGLELGSGISED